MTPVITSIEATPSIEQITANTTPWIVESLQNPEIAIGIILTSILVLIEGFKKYEEQRGKTTYAKDFAFLLSAIASIPTILVYSVIAYAIPWHEALIIALGAYVSIQQGAYSVVKGAIKTVTHFTKK